MQPLQAKSNKKNKLRKLRNAGNTLKTIAPVVHKSQQESLAALVAQLEESQWLEQNLLEELQLRQLQSLVIYCAKHSPYFSEKLKASGIAPEKITSLEKFRKIPILTRRDIQTSGEKLFCQNSEGPHSKFIEIKTSGSTGEPIVIRKTPITHLLWQANMMREHLWNKRNFMSRVLSIRGKIKTPVIHKNWGDPVAFLRKSGELIALPTMSSSKDQVNWILEFKPEHLTVYPNTLDAIMNYCETENIRITGLKHIWSIAETVSPQLRQRALKLFGAKIEDDYSSNEGGIIALQCPESGLYHIMSESVLVEILDEEGMPCKEGEIGKVIITSLHNFATPIIRYEIGDYAEVGSTCPCGRGLHTIKQIKGRNRNLVKKPDGTRHWPPLTRIAFEAAMPILQFQLIQHSFEDVEVRLVTKTKFTTEDEAKLTGHLHTALDHPFNLSFVYFEDRIPLPPSGKFDDYICLI